MNIDTTRITRLPNYLRKYGLTRGFSLFRDIERPLPHNSSQVRAFRVPGYVQPIHLRDSISDHATFWQCIVRDQYAVDAFLQAAALRRAYADRVARGERPLIIDCGGNIGLSTLYLAAAWPQARIVVVEPDDANFAMLKRNTAHLGDRVTALQGGIWNRPVRLKIDDPSAGSAAFRVSEHAVEGGEGLRAYTIDEVCDLAGEDHPLIVKLDIEGAQARLFADNTAWVARSDLIVLELDDWQLPWQGSSRSFFAALAGLPFDYLMAGESIFCFNGDRLAP